MKKGNGERGPGKERRRVRGREGKREKRDPCENKTKRSDCRLFGV